MAKKKYIEYRQIREISELIYENLDNENAIVVAPDPFLSKTVPPEEADKYLFQEVSNKKTYWNPVYEDWEIENVKEIDDDLKNKFIRQEVMPRVRVRWQSLGYELKKYDFNQEVTYKEDEFVFIPVSPLNPLLPPFGVIPFVREYTVYNCYFQGQLILEGITPEVCGDNHAEPFKLCGDKGKLDKIVINFSRDESTTLWIEEGKLHCRYSFNPGGLGLPKVQNYLYSTSAEKWMEV